MSRIFATLLIMPLTIPVNSDITKTRTHVRKEMVLVRCALVVFDRFGNNMAVILCDDKESAKQELIDWYRRELVDAEQIDFESTYIAEDKAVVDEIFKIKEARITHIKRKNEV